MTEKLYSTDAYAREVDATIVELFWPEGDPAPWGDLLDPSLLDRRREVGVGRHVQHRGFLLRRVGPAFEGLF